ncbi:MAG: hypothetical protein ACOVOG_07360 [Rubrivivax sp.]
MPRIRAAAPGCTWGCRMVGRPATAARASAITAPSPSGGGGCSVAHAPLRGKAPLLPGLLMLALAGLWARREPQRRHVRQGRATRRIDMHQCRPACPSTYCREPMARRVIT